MRHTGRALVLGSALFSLFALGCGSTLSPGEELEGASSEFVPELATSEAALSCSTTTSLVPAMTSATAPSGSVTRSGAYDSTYEAWKAFDSSNTSMWISTVYQTPAWIAYEWTDFTPRLVTSYAITFANGSLTSRAPSAWTLEGWNGSGWVVVDTRSGETGWAGLQTRTYTVGSPGSFLKYRLNITDDNDPSAGIVVVSMGRLELFGCGQTHCGYNGETCCPGQVCSGVLTCSGGTCQLFCGHIGESCCSGAYCVQGGCGTSGRCETCGYRNGPCCGNSCGFPLTCRFGFCQ
ncbi:discoidin domain-containing protein [Pyxidicoccus sp. MSG2]|uniref:discoidin domain-containing protein n=1 Tax=Pyxidicoccus sp. MSG2 TaxID=2996790 RepID=UPI00226FD397|nr:discoidin domain-containing protein [Pyxidicoccus sp. MSG2]MCY1014540.1 discoidin domain-containing protein [Pyxidicoccus sp. MSG2]